MKKSLLTLCFALAVCFAKATIYYQAYPIVVTQTTNGTDFRLECSVYDSSLATTQTFNTAYYEAFTNFGNANGIVIFDANNANNTGDYFIGCITYDFEVHQWKTNTVTNFDQGSYSTFIGNCVRFYWTDFIFETENLVVGYYDIVSHNWVMSTLSGAWLACNSVGVDQNILMHSSGDCTDNDDDFYAFNPAAHQWTYLTTVSPSPADFIDDGLAGAYMDFDPFNSDPPYLNVATLDPAVGTTNELSFGFYDISDYTVNSGIYCQRNVFNSEVEYGKYDAQQHLWKISAFPSADISSWKCNGGVISFVNGTSTIIINAVYNFNQHQWVYDSVPTPSVSAHAITNGTVTWNNGSGTITRGYNAVGGWGNSTTLPQAVFYTADLSSAGAGNLVYLRNYSIGATTWSYDFGDGVVSTEKNVFHLYKVGGSYLYSGASPSATICLTVTSPAGSNSSCQSVGCTPPVAAITAGGPTNFCTGGSVTLNVGTAAGYSYQWQLNTVDITGETNSSYVANAAGSYTCIVTNACGTDTSNAISITINAGPTAAITAGGSTTFCTGGSVTLNANTGAGLSYQWQLNNNDISGQTNSSYAATASGSYTCNVINSCGTVASNAITVTVNTGTVAVINNLSGSTYMCPGNIYNYSVNNISGATFNWTVPANVTVSSGQGTNAVILSVAAGFTAGSVCVNATNGCSTSLSKCKGVATNAPGRPTGISGALNGVCASTQSYTAAAVAGATGYTWSVVGGTLQSGQGTQTVSVLWNSTGTTGTLNVTASNACGSGLVRSVGTTLKPEVAAAISGPGTLCAGSTNNIFTIPAAVGASTYTWQITPGGSIITSGQGSTSINATWGTTSGTVLCTPYNACGSSKTKQLAVTVNCRIGGNSDDVTSHESSLIELNAYPNPFNDKINIQLNSNDDAAVFIKITDVTGRIIDQQLINANSVYAMGENMTNGIYFVEARQNDSIKTIRVVKSK